MSLSRLGRFLFGGVFAGSVRPVVAALHVVALFCAVYTAHVKDGYVDFHVRGEDDDHPLTVAGCRGALVGAAAGFVAALAGLWVTVGPAAAALTAPTWALGYFHAPQLDTNVLGATAGYPLGIALALVGGYYVQAERLSATVLGLAAVFFLFLSGIKIIDDSQDYDYDRSIDKRTVAVVLGPERARRFAYGLMAVGMAVVLAGATSGVFPPASALAPLVFGVVAAFAWRAGEDVSLATKLLIRGSYLFLAVLVAAVGWESLG